MRRTIGICSIGIAMVIGCAGDQVMSNNYSNPDDNASNGAGQTTGMTNSSNGGVTGASDGMSSSDGATGSDGAMGSDDALGSDGMMGGVGTMSSDGMVGGDTMGSDGMAGNGSGSDDTGTAGPCDLRGRWISTVHYVTEAIGQQQTGHIYIYYDIAATQDGGFEVTKGLRCGDWAHSAGLFAVDVNLSGARDQVRENVTYTGRPVSSTEASDGCQVQFGKWYTVRGATLPHYLDPNVALPTAADQASGSTPGWEDWDGDGNPGVTGVLTGTVNGKIFTAARQWMQIDATVPDTSSSFIVPLVWDQEANVMAFDPPDNFTLGAPSVRAANPDLHFVEFARLGPDQALGADDKAICEGVLNLVDTLTPTAAAL